VRAFTGEGHMLGRYGKNCWLGFGTFKEYLLKVKTVTVQPITTNVNSKTHSTAKI
jgi:hypothetical protein